MSSGWIEHELQQLTIKSQQFFTSEIKRCINSLNFIHSYYLAKKEEKPLSQFENRFPQKFSLSLLDESSSESEKVELPKVEDPNDPEIFPLLNAIFAKGLSIINEIEQGKTVYDPSDFEILNAIQIEKNILIYRLLAIRSWTIRGLKDIRHKINEAYDLLDDWIVIHIKNENETANKTVEGIREIIETNDPIEPELKITKAELTDDNEDQIQFIETIGCDKSFIQGKSRSKFSLEQARDYLDIFKRHTRDDIVEARKAKNIIITNLKLIPDLIPPKWKEYPLTHIDQIVSCAQKEETDVVNWRNLITY